MSAKPSVDRPLSKLQFWIAVGGMAVCGVLALVVLAGVAGPHGKCPTETQTSRPGASTCWAAYVQQNDTGVVGTKP